MKASFLILLLLSVYGQASQRDKRTDLAETEILEAVFRYQIGNCYRDRSPQLYFLSYMENDPTDSLMERLKDLAPSVRKRSQMSKFRDKDTGSVGILLAIQRISRNSRVLFEVKGICGAAPLDAYFYEYRIELKNRKWTVKSRKLRRVS